MRISESKIMMESNYTFQSQSVKKESLEMWQDAPQQMLQIDTVDISGGGSAQQIAQVEGNNEFKLQISDEDRVKIEVVERMLSFLLGRKIKIRIPGSIQQGESGAVLKLEGGNGNDVQRVGWGAVYRSSESYRETEKMSFASKGVVKTADGREINFSVDVNLARSYSEYSETEIRMGDGKRVDPLVLNFNGGSAGLSDLRFEFDLNADGKLEDLAFLRQGSGFLALDKNNDGIINDGTELFGPTTGDGFGELAAYDSDGNGWIDEADYVFDRLRIWMKDENGADKLLTLAEAGVGAIYLGNVDTQFGLASGGDRRAAEIRQTGIFLLENGGASTVQHIDYFI